MRESKIHSLILI